MNYSNNSKITVTLFFSLSDIVMKCIWIRVSLMVLLAFTFFIYAAMKMAERNRYSTIQGTLALGAQQTSSGILVTNLLSGEK